MGCALEGGGDRLTKAVGSLLRHLWGEGKERKSAPSKERRGKERKLIPRARPNLRTKGRIESRRGQEILSRTKKEEGGEKVPAEKDKRSIATRREGEGRRGHPS